MNKVWIIAVIVVVALGGLGVLFTGNNQVGTFAQSIFSTPQNTLGLSTDIFCNDYEFTCCVPTVKSEQDSINYNVYSVCPASSTGCVISNVQSQVGQSAVKLYYGSQNCRLVQRIIPIAKVLVCDDQQTVTVSNGASKISIPRGYSFFTDVYSDKASVTLDVNRENLVFCGRAGCTQGVIKQYDSCALSVSTGNIYLDTVNKGTSYTMTPPECALSWQSTDRHVCGTLLDECTTTADCVATHPNTCSADTLQGYECKPAGLPSSITYVNGQYVSNAQDPFKTSTISATRNQCVIGVAQKVSCCGDNECGSNAFCDLTSHTCKATTECKVASDCGVSAQCDYSTKKLKTPTCSLGQCSYSTKNVGCCIDSNCADTQTCDLSTHTCKDKPVNIVACTFGCCSGDTLYFDKPCSSGQFCINHACSVTPQCTTDASCPSGNTCVDGVCKVVSNETCASSLGGLVTRSIGTKAECNFWCSIGLKSPEKINVCVTDYTPLTLVGIFVLLLVAILIFGLRGRGKSNHKASANKSSGKVSKVLKSGLFWKVVVGIVAIVLLILYFKILIWVAIGIVVVLILDGIFFHRKIWNALKRMFGKKK